MSTDAVRAALAELVACQDELDSTKMSMFVNSTEFARFLERNCERTGAARAAARAALSEPAPGDVAQWLASVDADGYRTDEDEGHGVAREAFERAMAKAGYHLNPDVYRDGTYRDTEYRAGWEMWQAASDPAPTSKPAALDVSLDQSACELLFTMLHPSTPDDEYSEIRLQLGDGHSGYGLYVSAVECPEEGAELVCAAPAHAVDERAEDSGHLAAASNGSPCGAWVPVIEHMPSSGVTVLACYTNRAGNVRRIRAEWVAAKTIESYTDSEISEYDEATDCFYDPEGWYEKIDNWGDYSSVAVVEGEVTHWMQLPAPPQLNLGADGQMKKD